MTFSTGFRLDVTGLLLLALTACGGGGTDGIGGSSSTSGNDDRLGGKSGSSAASGSAPAALTPALTSSPPDGSGESYVLRWNPTTDSRVVGYKLYYSTEPFTLEKPKAFVQLGVSTQYEFTLRNLGVGRGNTLYFALSALDGSTETGLSAPVSLVVR